MTGPDSLALHEPSVRAPIERPRVLVVGTDLTKRDVDVASAAVRLAVLLDASVLLVHAVEVGAGEDSVPAARASERLGAAWTAIDLESARVSQLDPGGRTVVRVAVAEGSASDALCRTTTEARRAWVVVGAGADPTKLGVTCERLLRDATCPVLVIPEGCASAFDGRVLGVFEGGVRGARVVQVAEVVASAMGRELEVLRVETAEGRSPASTIAEHAARASSGLVVVGTAAPTLACTSPAPLLVVR